MSRTRKEVKKELLEIFNPRYHDWMNYIIDNEEITYHHIQKEEDGGEYTLDNGALLTHRAHDYLHYIEKVDSDIYEEINKVFKEINESREKPTYNQKLKIELLLFEFELKNCDRIIKKKEKIEKERRPKEATLRRIRCQLGEYV